ncbi:hypothetical protein HD806DRAFT_440806 [Xylariaceae sp. AK1471]|nr:hypothetical protein HD806DRAFT_440806 [Xylariaceae sp. AK1471]
MAHAVENTDTSPPSVLRATGSGSKPACDRCRGQKLRCAWEPDLHKCNRCIRAGTVCAMPPRRPIGRPPSRINSNTTDTTREHVFNSWDKYQDDTSMSTSINNTTTNPNIPVPPPTAGGSNMTSMRNAPWPASPGNIMPDDAPWSSAFMPSSSTVTASSAQWDFSNFAFTPPASLQLSLEELVNEFSGSPTVVSGIGTSTQSSPHSTNDVNHQFGATGYNNNISPGSLDAGNDVPMPRGDSVPRSGNLRSRTGDINYVKQLCDVHIALVQHPLHNEALAKQAQDPAGTSARVADLQLGRLFALTVQLKEMTGSATSFTGDNIAESSRKVPNDNATILLAFSCHERLDQLYARAIETLRDAQKSDQGLDASYQLMPGLSVDGFSLGACQDFQLSFVLQLCEQIRHRLAASLKGVRGTLNSRNKTSA